MRYRRLLPFAPVVLAPVAAHAGPPATQMADAWPTTQKTDEGIRATMRQLFAATQSTADALDSTRAIDAIIYSSLSKEQMIDRLKHYVAVMDTVDNFKQHTNLKPTLTTVSGWGVIASTFGNCGLVVIFDPDGKVRRLQRAEKTVGGVVYPAMCITEPQFDWNGALNTY